MANGGWGQSRSYLRMGAFVWSAPDERTSSGVPTCLAEVGRAIEHIEARPTNRERPSGVHRIESLWAPIPVHRRKLKSPELRILRDLRKLAS